MTKRNTNSPRGFENVTHMRFPGVGPYDIPQIAPMAESCRPERWIGINYLSRFKAPSIRQQLAVHFFLDDYQFSRVWTVPHQYIPALQGFSAVCSPDFSLYADMPLAMQIYNHYRKHWLGAYWQLYGVRVVPAIAWSTPDSYRWCYDGEPTHSTVAVSSVGSMGEKASRLLFISGYHEMVRRLQPAEVLFMGQVPGEVEQLAPITKMDPFTRKFDEMRGK